MKDLKGKLRCDAMIGKPGGGFTPAREERPCPRLAKYEAVGSKYSPEYASPLHYCELHKGRGTDSEVTRGRVLKPLKNEGVGRMKSRNEMSSRLKKELPNVEIGEAGEAGEIEEDDYPDYNWYDDLYSRGWVSVLDEILVAKPPMTRREIQNQLKSDEESLEIEEAAWDDEDIDGRDFTPEMDIDERELEARIEAWKWVLK